MIPHNELRLGNIVHVDSKDTSGKNTLLTIQLRHIDLMRILGGNNDAYPIDITEDWISKFNFWKRQYAGSKPVYFLESNGFEFSFDEAGIDFCYKSANIAIYLSHIKHIHQLQNLYFDLTGEELIINERAGV